MAATLQNPNLIQLKRILELQNSDLGTHADAVSTIIEKLRDVVEAADKKDLDHHDQRQLETALSSKLQEVDLTVLENLDANLNALATNDLTSKEGGEAAKNIQALGKETLDALDALNAGIDASGHGDLIDAKLLGKLQDARDSAENMIEILARTCIDAYSIPAETTGKQQPARAIGEADFSAIASEVDGFFREYSSPTAQSNRATDEQFQFFATAIQEGMDNGRSSKGGGSLLKYAAAVTAGASLFAFGEDPAKQKINQVMDDLGLTNPPKAIVVKPEEASKSPAHDTPAAQRERVKAVLAKQTPPKAKPVLVTPNKKKNSDSIVPGIADVANEDGGTAPAPATGGKGTAAQSAERKR